MSHCESARVPVEVKNFLSHDVVGCNIREGGQSLFGSQGRGLDLGCLFALRCENASRGETFLQNFSTFFKTGFLHVSGLWDYFKGKNVWHRIPGHSVLGQNDGGAGRCGTKLCGAGRQWGRTSWGRRSMGQNLVGQNFVGQDVTWEIYLGQDVSRAGGSGAGSRES